MNKRKFISGWTGGVLVALIFTISTMVAFGGTLPLFSVDSAMLGQTESLLIDDFSNSNGISIFGTRWRMFTDRVMGGLSTASSKYTTIDGRQCLQLIGDVSLANNGGFVQVALPLTESGWPFDASAFKGVRIWARGNGEDYHIHLRTSDSRRPWQYYGAKFTPDKSWNKYDIPFSDFSGESLSAPIQPGKLTRIAVVAIKKEIKADIAVARLELYR